MLTVSGSTPELGVVCSAATSVNDTDVTRAGFDSFVIDTLTNNAQDLTPPFCVEGLSLNDVLDFSSEDARMFGIGTDGGTGFADFLGITGNLSGGD